MATSSESTDDPKAKAAFFIVEANRQQLAELGRLLDAGALRPIVREVFPISIATQAYLAPKNSTPGKIVLCVLTH